MNLIHIVKCYKYRGNWVIDDPNLGVKREPFIGETNKVIDQLVDGVDNAEYGFNLVFSSDHFLGDQLGGMFMNPDPVYGGSWYQLIGSNPVKYFWLCDVLLRYFHRPPKTIYAAADPYPHNPLVLWCRKAWRQLVG